MNAMNRYLGLVVDTVQANYKTYNTEDKLVAYFKGLYNHDAITAGSIKYTYFTQISNAVTKDNLISNFYFISDTVDSLVTTQSTQTNLYSSYLATAQGALTASNPNSYFLFCNTCEADNDLGTENTEYGLRLVKHLSGTKAYMMVDISYEVLSQTLQTMDCSESSLVGLITSEGTEFYPADTAKASISDASFNLNAAGNDESEGMQYVNYQGTEYLFLFSKIGNRNATIFALIPNQSYLHRLKIYD